MSSMVLFSSATCPGNRHRGVAMTKTHNQVQQASNLCITQRARNLKTVSGTRFVHVFVPRIFQRAWNEFRFGPSITRLDLCQRIQDACHDVKKRSGTDTYTKTPRKYEKYIPLRRRVMRDAWFVCSIFCCYCKNLTNLLEHCTLLFLPCQTVIQSAHRVSLSP